MAELVGGAFLSSFLAVLFDRIASCRQVVDFFCKPKINNELLRKLKLKLLSVNEVLDDAEEKQISKPAVREWLDELKDALYVAGDLLDEIKTEALRRKLEVEESGSSIASVVQNPNSTSFDEFFKVLEPKIMEILERLEDIVNEKDVLGLKEVGAKDRPHARTRESTSLVDDSGVYGRNQEREAIIKLLLSDDPTHDKISVIPIVGMGGIGKTTLAQLVFNDVRVKQHFDLKAWVCVSEEFDFLRITQKIYRSITSETCELMELDDVQSILKEVLTTKKFLFVLDDVWNENYIYWDGLRRPFEFGAAGSMIIITARNEGVASMMGTLPTHRLMQISEKDCWLLFAKHALKNSVDFSAHPNLEMIGRQIVHKCKGHPLATKSLGGLLRSELNMEAWENILKSDIWELSDKENNILPALWLSYYNLPSHLKRCFSYCSIFPKDYEFTRSELVLLWMAEDLIQPENSKTVDKVGEIYFDNLVSRSFFQLQPTKKENSLLDCSQSFYTMHDLINDLAKFISGEFCCRLEDNDDSINISSKSRHFSYMKEKCHGFKRFKVLHEAKYLHTFLPLPLLLFQNGPLFAGLDNALHDLMSNLQFLRMLNLSNYAITELPNAISNLKHLRHLDLSGTSIKKLPDTVCILYNLHTLLLLKCEALVELPNKLARLINLRYLEIRGTKLKRMPPDMRRLKDLQFLPEYILDKHTGHSIAELKELRQVRKSLYVSGLQNIVHAGEPLEANIMSDKKYLSTLVLKWGGDTEDPEKDREVLNKLQPHTNLKELVVESYGGIRFPGWLGDPSFSNLSCVQISGCKHCCFLPPLGQLPSVRKLVIDGLNNVVEIGTEFHGNDTCGMKPFRSLEELTFRNMLEWQEWFYVGGNVEEGGIFPNLCQLTLLNCPKLAKLPLDNFLKLERLQLWNLKSFSGSLSHVESKFLSLSYLNVLNCPNFVCFRDGGIEALKLKEMCIYQCEKLRSLPEQMHTLLPSLQSLQVRRCPELESFPEGGLPSTLESLWFDCSRKLVANRTHWGLQRLNSLKDLRVDFKEWGGEVDLFPEEGLLPTTLTHLFIYNLQKITTIQGNELRQLISLEELTISGCPELQCLPEEALNSLQGLWILRCPKLQCLPQGGLPTSLSRLEIRGCPLLERRLNRNTGEDWSKIVHIPEITINHRLICDVDWSSFF